MTKHFSCNIDCIRI